MRGANFRGISARMLIPVDKQRSNSTCGNEACYGISHAPQPQGQGPSPPNFLGPYRYPYHLTQSDQIQHNNPQKEPGTPQHTPTWYDVEQHKFCKVTMWGVTFLRGPIRSDPGSGSYGAKTLGDTTTYARTIWLGWILMRDLLAVANLLVISSIIVPNHIMFSKIWLADIWMHLQENSKELTTSPDNCWYTTLWNATYKSVHNVCNVSFKSRDKLNNFGGIHSHKCSKYLPFALCNPTYTSTE